MKGADRGQSKRWILRTAGLLGLLLVAGLAFHLVGLARDPVAGFAARRGTLRGVLESERQEIEGHWQRDVRLTSSSGLEFSLTIKRPPDDTSRRPLIVLLGGHRTGRDAVALIPETRGLVVAALSYPYEGNHRPGTLEALTSLPRIRRALLDTPPAVMLAVDYLSNRPFVDPERIELVGVSLGAYLGAVTGAEERRFRRVWLMHGGGTPRAVFDHLLRERIPFGPARSVAARILALEAAGPHLAPELWVGRIAPRPVVLVNGRRDDRLPRPAIEALHAGAREPAEVIWLPGAHVEPGRKDEVGALIDLVLHRLGRPDREHPGLRGPSRTGDR